MRIAIAHSFYRVPGGEDRYVRQQVDLLSKTHEVELLGAQNQDLSQRVAVAARMAFSRRQRDQVLSELVRFHPDVIHLHNPYPSLGPAVHLAARRLGTPLVVTVHNNRLRCPNGLTFTEGEACFRCIHGNTAHALLHECFPSRGQAAAYAGALWLHRFALQLEKVVALYIAPSEFMRNRLIQWGFDPQRVRVVRNFTDAPRAPAASPGREGLYLGRLDIGKGLETLLEALVLADDPPFLIAGDGPLRPSLVERATRLGLKSVRFPGVLDRSQVARALQMCRYLVVPSECDENAPLATLEAMAAARPVLVSDKGGLPELVDMGGGIMFPAGDAAALASSIQSLSADDQLYERLSLRAASVSDEQFTPERHLENLERTYSGAI